VITASKVKVRDVIRELRAAGWYEIRRTATGHRHFKHPTVPGRVTVSGGLSDEMPIGTLKSVRKQSGLRLT